MEYTKKDVQEAVVTIAKMFNLEKNYLTLIESGITLPELIKMIVFEMFVQDCSYASFLSLEESNSYNIIFEYSRELKTIGFVTFKK